MKQKKVFLMSGPPGAGKSSWCRSKMTLGCEWISRDRVRFSFLDKNDSYFAHEDEVFDTFINYINQTLEDEKIHTIFIDATHVDKRSRQRVLKRIRKENIEELNCVCFQVPLEVCQARNNLRSGREKVPHFAIDNMHLNFRIPNREEENFDHIIIVDENGNETEV